MKTDRDLAEGISDMIEKNINVRWVSSESTKSIETSKYLYDKQAHQNTVEIYEMIESGQSIRMQSGLMSVFNRNLALRVIVQTDSLAIIRYARYQMQYNQLIVPLSDPECFDKMFSYLRRYMDTLEKP